MQFKTYPRIIPTMTLIFALEGHGHNLFFIVNNVGVRSKLIPSEQYLRKYGNVIQNLYAL